MTIRLPQVRREIIRDWPIFSGLSVDGIGVLSVEITRRPGESVSSAAAEAAAILAASLARLGGSEQQKILLLAIGKLIDPSARVAAFHAERAKLWTALEKTGIVVPVGTRIEARVDRPDGSFAFVGSIDVDPGELPRALEVTRRENAVCLATKASASLEAILAAAAGASNDAGSLLKAFIDLPSEALFLMRAFGHFDDATVGAEIFSQTEFLDLLQPVLMDGS